MESKAKNFVKGIFKPGNIIKALIFIAAVIIYCVVTERLDKVNEMVLPASKQKLSTVINQANAGNASAQFELGKRYYSEKIYPGAVKCFRQAAEQGHAEAQYNLGVCYANGCGMPKDLQQAIYWYTKAAEQGNEDAQKALMK